LAKKLPRKQAIKMCFIFSPNASALPSERDNPEIASFHLNSVESEEGPHVGLTIT